MNRLQTRLWATLALFSFFSACSAKEEDPLMQSIAVNATQFQGAINYLQQPARQNVKGTLVGIHGTPGSWTAWRALMKEEFVLNNYNFVALDRPGWGDSRDTQNDPVYPKFADQTAILSQSLNLMTLERPIIIVAHSWGGPVALALAADSPELVDGLIVIASPADPELSEPRWYHKAAKWKAIQWMIGKSMTRSNLEMLTLDQELIELKANLSAIQQPTVIMQGKKDWLVKPGNAFYLQRQLVNAPVNLNYDVKANHFIPFKKTEDVVDAIKWTMEALLTQTAKNQN